MSSITGSQSLDASNLLMPLVFFVAPSDPRILKTLEAINQSPENGGLVSNSLVYRYNPEASPDGLNGHEGAFNICTFWLVEAMSRAGRYDPKALDQARLIFEKMLSYANHLGLYAEETGHSGEGLGNFPPGLHPPGPDQRRLQPGPGHRHRRPSIVVGAAFPT